MAKATMLELLSPEFIMNFQLIRIAIAVVGTGIAAYFDMFNNRNVPDKLLYAFLAVAVLVMLADFNTGLIIYSIGVAVVISLFGYLLYKSGQIGAADVFVFASLALLLPIQPTFFADKPLFELPFIFSIIASAGFFLIFYTILRFSPSIISRTIGGKVKLEKTKIAYAAMMLIVYLLVLYFLYQLPFFPFSYIVMIGLLVIASIFFVLFKDEMNTLMIENVKLKNIEEEDIIAVDRMDKKLVEKYKIPKVISLNDLKRLKKADIKLYPVYKHLPMFLPFILVGLILSVYFGDLIYLMTATAFGSALTI